MVKKVLNKIFSGIVVLIFAGLKWDKLRASLFLLNTSSDTMFWVF